MSENENFQRIIAEIVDNLDKLYPGWTLRSTDILPPPPPPLDQTLGTIVRHPCVVLVIGHRGSGKSALACRLQELLRDQAAPYAIGLPLKAAKLLPDWYGLADDPGDVPQNTVIYIPESYRVFHARSAQSAQGRQIGDLVNLSRHRRQTLIFDVQNPAHLDRNIISEPDVVLIKEPGPFTQGFERPQLRPMMDSARAAFSAVSGTRKKRAVWVIAPHAGIQGALMENLLPSFWTDSLSHIFADVGVGSSLTVSKPTYRRGHRTSSKERKARAQHLHSIGHSYGEIGKMLGISKSQSYRLVNDK